MKETMYVYTSLLNSMPTSFTQVSDPHTGQ